MGKRMNQDRIWIGLRPIRIGLPLNRFLEDALYKFLNE